MEMGEKEIEDTLKKYSEMLITEVSWGVPLAELRHLIGRLGELYVANEYGGTMALNHNEKGFDVTVGKENISVKTTSTTSPKHYFYFNKNTLKYVTKVIILNINEDAEIAELLNASIDDAKKFMTKRGKKLVIKRSKLSDNNKEKYLNEKSTSKNPTSEELIRFDFNQKEYSLLIKDKYVRVKIDEEIVYQNKKSLKEVCDGLQIKYGKNTETITLARKIIDRMQL